MIRTVLLCLGLASSIPALAADAAPVIYSARISGSINPGAAAYLDRVIQLASSEAHSSAVLLELNTPGGLLASTREMVQSISRSRVPVLIYVGPSGASATSAGAILLMASHAAGMSPGTNVGAAHPVASGGEEIKGAMGEKAVNDTVALMRSLAEQRNRPPNIAEEIVRKSRSFSAKEAYEVNLVDAVTESVELFLGAVDGKKVKLERAQTEIRLQTKGAILKSVQMTVGQKLLHFLADPNVATTLMSLGGLLIYVEVANPGITIAGILGGICLITGFMSFQLLPVRTGGLVLMLLGFLMFILEAFVTSHGALAAGGLLSLVLGILWVMDPAGGALRIDPQVWVPVVITLGVAVAAMSWAMARTQSLVKKALAAMHGGEKSGLQGYPGIVEWIDPQNPSHGRVQIRGELWNAVALDGSLELGETVEVVRVDGLTIQVRAAAQS